MAEPADKAPRTSAPEISSRIRTEAIAGVRLYLLLGRRREIHPVMYALALLARPAACA
jgi:hypothetical protein